MTLVCAYAATCSRRMQLLQAYIAASSCRQVRTMDKSEAETEVFCVDLMFWQ